MMMARKKVVSVWKASDIGTDSAQLDKGNAHTEVTALTVPTRKTECEIIAGATPEETAANLAAKINALI